MKLADRIRELNDYVDVFDSEYHALHEETLKCAAEHDALMQRMAEALEQYTTAANFRAAALVAGDGAKVMYADELFWRSHDEACAALRAYKEQQ